uniref:NADH-ubiquinone oxidoreductase chain 2 n=1 Tax=Cucujoidea sp. 37 KM-2017 TaxID=2219375 RepID=A0A346RGR7_9CUCU|nr:NADH dehydrogenase subunit 2 [Cucujoidea sp. 37 KM-2017]
MHKNFKILFLNTLFISSLLTISSTSWFIMWIGLEINLLSIVPLMMTNQNLYRSESCMKYFIVQAIASAFLLYSMASMQMADTTPHEITMPSMIFFSALMMKMGMAPFHYWFPEVLEGLNWKNCLIMMTWQKIAPSCLIMYFITPNQTMAAIIAMSTIISSFMGMKQTSIRKILAYSSINHMAWMLVTMMISPVLWFIYFSIYAITNFAIIYFLEKTWSNEINQMNSASLSQDLSKIMFAVNLFSLGGLPPLVGFLPKWLTIMDMTLYDLMVMALLIILFTLITLMFYLRLGFSSYMKKNDKLINSNKFYLPNWIPTINVILMLSLIILPPITS